LVEQWLLEKVAMSYGFLEKLLWDVGCEKSQKPFG
jgi:hypothetical protein